MQVSPERHVDTDLAVLKRGSIFSSRLRRALWDTWLAQENNKVFIVGLDADPFLNGQDFNDRFVVGKIRRKGHTWFVQVHGVPSGGEMFSNKVTVQVQRAQSGWVMTNFIDGPRADDDLLTALSQCRSEWEPWLSPTDIDTPLLTALKEGRRDRALALIAKGGNVNQTDSAGNAPLHIAAYRCYADVARALLDRGAKIDAKNKAAETPLFLALHNCRDLAIEKLGASIDPSIAKDLSSRDPLKVVTLLLDRGANVNLPAGEFQQTPLMAAATYGDETSVVELLFSHGADVTQKDNMKGTALDWAVWNTRPNVVRSLLRHGADPNAKDDKGWTPLDRLYDTVRFSGDDAAASIKRVLRAAGANHQKPTVTPPPGGR